MSDETQDERTSAEIAEPHLGVFATIRQTTPQVRALLAGVFVSRLAGFLQIFLVLFLTHRGFSPAEAGLALTLYGAGSVLGTTVGGYLSDRLSARTATLISMGGSAVLIVSIIYIKIYALLLVAVFLVSSIGLFFRPAAQAMLTDLTPSGSLVMVTALYRLCLNLGTSAAPLIGVALVSVSYNLLFWAEGLAALVYGLIAMNFLPKKDRQAEPTAAEAESAAAAGPAAATDKRKSGYQALAGDWRYMFYLASVLFITLAYVQYTATLPLAIVHAKLSLWWYSAVVTLNAVVVASCEVLVTKYVQTWPLRLTALLGFGFTAIGYGLYGIAVVPVVLICGTLFWTMSEMVGAPTTFAYPGLVAPPELRGRYFGAMQSTFGLAAALGPVIGVTLWNHLGQGVWLCACASGVAAAICAQVGWRLPGGAGKAPAPAQAAVSESAS
jgi:MFS family permease